jgi:DNA replication and repair protein RecF
VHVRHLSLVRFRNYDRLDLDLSPDVTVLWGDNAQGKSNLLEAVYYLATMRSFRATGDRDLIQWGSTDDPIAFTRIGARVERAGESFNLEVILRQEARRDETDATALTKRVKLNDVPKRAIDVVGATTAVMFSPQDLELVDGAPGLRRRYLDVTISQADSRYCRDLAHYNRVLLQRNHLLRAVRDRGAPVDQLHFWNRELIASGSYIVKSRIATIQAVGEIARRRYAELSRASETVGVGYKSSVLAGVSADGWDPDQITSRFEERLAELQTREVTLGASLVGPHRDDLAFEVGGHDLGSFGSRGQQRTVALALKLAEAEHLVQQTREQPVLLLDDVFSELDPHRRARVLETIQPGQQVLFTSSDPATQLRFSGNATWLRVARGRLESADVAAPPRLLAE